MSILSVKDLKYFYQDGSSTRDILKGINYEFKRGSFYTIVGPSGSGKTTFLALTTALDEPKSGQVLFEGEDIKKLGHSTYRNSKVGIVFQAYNLITYLSALQNVILAMDITSNKVEDKTAKALELLDSVGIDETKANRSVLQLSGGEQQRVAIARSLSTDVDLIIADEPTGNLDSDTENEVIDIFKKLAHKQNKCVMVVTHSKEVAQKSDISLNLKKGKFEEKINIKTM